MQEFNKGFVYFVCLVSAMGGLLDVWIRRNGLRYTEAPMINLERQHWIRKGTAFIQRKMKGAEV